MENNTNLLFEFQLPPTISNERTRLLGNQNSSANDKTTRPLRVETSNQDLEYGDNQSYLSISAQDSDSLFENASANASLSAADSSNQPSTEPHNIYIRPSKRPYKDMIFVFSYAATMLIFLIFASISLIKTKNEGYSSLFVPLWNSAHLLISLIMASFALSIFYISLLSQFASTIITLTATLLPLSISGISLVSLLKFLYPANGMPHGEESEFKTMAFFSLCGVFFGIYTGWVAWRSRKMLSTLTLIVHLATEILVQNSSLFVLSASLSLVHLGWSIAWLWTFSHLFLWGTGVGHEGTISISLDGGVPFAAFFFVLIYFWTSAIFQNMEKVTVASVVGEWYFDQSHHSNTPDQTWYHFGHVSTKSFGPISFASLILGFVRSAKFFLDQFEKNAPNSLRLNRLVKAVVGILIRLLENISSYTLVHVGLSGQSLLSAAYECSNLFRRTMVIGLLTSNLCRLISFAGKIFVSFMIGLACFWSNVSFRMKGEWITMFVATLIPYYVMGILTHVVETTIDATFICYLVDLNNHQVRNPKAHRVFSSSLK